MDISKLIREYRSVTSALCYYLSLTALIAKRIERGQSIDMEYLYDTLQQAEVYYGKFLSARDRLHLPTDSKALSAFTETFLFDGFSLKEGQIEGEPALVESICSKWMHTWNAAPTEEEALRFEIATYCIMSSGGTQTVFISLLQNHTYGAKKPILNNKKAGSILQKIRSIKKEFFKKVRKG